MRAIFAKRLLREQRGATAIEFAFVAPVMCGLLMGLCDLLYQSYAQSILDGAMYKAGRDSALENNTSNATQIDAKVEAMVSLLGPGMKFEPDRRSYSSFLLVKPEQITDKNGNGRLDKGECFDDVNGNKQWDADPGRRSQGGANDVTRYTMRVTYTRLFPVFGLFGMSPKQTIVGETLLKNQPYRTQVTQPVESVCIS